MTPFAPLAGFLIKNGTIDDATLARAEASMCDHGADDAFHFTTPINGNPTDCQLDIDIEHKNDDPSRERILIAKLSISGDDWQIGEEAYYFPDEEDWRRQKSQVAIYLKNLTMPETTKTEAQGKPLSTVASLPPELVGIIGDRLIDHFYTLEGETSIWTVEVDGPGENA